MSGSKFEVIFHEIAFVSGRFCQKSIVPDIEILCQHGRIDRQANKCRTISEKQELEINSKVKHLKSN